MTEVVLDFSNINTNTELAKYLSKQLNFQREWQGNSWDAFADLFSDILHREFDGIYREKDMWDDYQDFLDYIEEDKRIGPKNNKGVRDDLTLRLVNFQPLCYKYSSLAQKMLSTMIGEPERIKAGFNYEGGMKRYEKKILKLKIYIES